MRLWSSVSAFCVTVQLEMSSAAYKRSNPLQLQQRKMCASNCAEVKQHLRLQVCVNLSLALLASTMILISEDQSSDSCFVSSCCLFLQSEIVETSLGSPGHLWLIQNHFSVGPELFFMLKKKQNCSQVMDIQMVSTWFFQLNWPFLIRLTEAEENVTSHFLELGSFKPWDYK